MTITKNFHKEEINGTTYFREQYMDKDMNVYMWRYGYIVHNLYSITLRSNLLSRPNLKRLFQ